MGNSVSGKDEPSPSLSLATRLSGKDGALLRSEGSGLPAVSRKWIVFFLYIIILPLTKLVGSEWLDIDLVIHFCVFLDIESVSVRPKKGTESKVLGQYPAIFDRIWSITHVRSLTTKYPCRAEKLYTLFVSVGTCLCLVSRGWEQGSVLVVG